MMLTQKELDEIRDLDLRRNSRHLLAHIDALAARLAEAIECCTIKDNRNLRLEAKVADLERQLHWALTGDMPTDSADDVINAQHDETGRTWRGPRSQLPRRYFEVEAICCLDYPRCDCNSPPEPDNLPCGHPASLLLMSAETGEALYCELCDDKSGRRDAEQCETELRAEVERLKTALKTVGDDYPGSSCQQWCYEAAGIRAPAEWPTREEAEKRAAELMAIGRATLAAADSADDEWHCSQYPGCECFAGCREKALEGQREPLDTFEEGIADALGYKVRP